MNETAQIAQPDSGGKAASPPTISLPKGGGAIRGLGEKFAANPVTGTGSLSVPIYTSPGRAGFGPQFSLSYDSGSGNGLFGVGWSLSIPSITRKTDKGLPQYRDDKESDVFILAGSEDLVPVLSQSVGKWQRDRVIRTVEGAEYGVQLYRPRIEGLFARVERWTNVLTGVIHWRSITKDNITTIYGKDAGSIISDPAESQPPHRIFTWLISESYDDRGNAIVYEYKSENAENVDRSQANEQNRSAAGRSANRYLKRIRYGNRVSRLIEPDLSQAQWMFEVVFDYGEHDDEAPTPNDAGAWLCRNDPFSTYRAGFEVRTYRLCQRVLMFHHFPDEDGVGQDCLVRSTDFAYQNTRNDPDDLKRGNPVASFISFATQTGYRRTAGGYLRKSMPPLEFEYSQATIHEETHEVDGESLENLPDGLDGALYQWVDLDGEGLSGILSEQANGWFYKRNLSPISIQNDNGKETVVARFAPVETVAVRPSPASLGKGGQQFLDLAGDGQPDLVQFSRPLAGYYEHTQDGEWSTFTPFISNPEIAWDDPNLKFVDLTGDGHADIIVSEDGVFTWYPSLAERGFDAAERVYQSLDEEQGPRLVFADSTLSVFLADMSGDGLNDLVRVRDGEVCYWPNLGYGRFGAKVSMNNAPLFDRPELFAQGRIHLADIDGSGVTDLLYLAGDGVYIYFNQSGNGWTDARKLDHFPPIDSVASVSAMDLLGNGTACLVWSCSLPGVSRQPMRYIDLMGGQKPHLLVGMKNNMGAETIIRYAPSTRFYLLDKYGGSPWVTRLPFPVHVVERVETIDRISRNRFVTRYAYHHGYFDGLEREFRGFGMVEQWDTEEFATLSSSDALPDSTNVEAASHVPPVLTRTWFHTGAWIDGTKITKQFAHEYYDEGDASLGGTELTREQLRAMLLDDTILPDSVKLKDGTRIPWSLSTDEVPEAVRTLKGSLLRQEVYALDGTEESDRPYSVSEKNYTIELLQPRGSNRHAVFLAHPRESLDFHYERKLYDVDNRRLCDPRVSHSMILSVDGFGNVLEAVAVGYGRRRDDPDPLLTAEDNQNQGRTLISATQNQYTNAVEEEDAYRAPLNCETRSYQLYNLETDSNHPDVTNLFRIDEMADKLQSAGDGFHDIPYENVGASAIPPGIPYRRLIGHTRTLFRRDDLSGALPQRALESLALGFDAYKLAFTPELLSAVYQRSIDNQPPENLLPDPVAVLRVEGGYVDLDSDGNWWIPSGRVFYHPDENATPAQELDQARAHFFLPRRFQDAFLNSAVISYDKDSKDVEYDLLESLILDAAGNEISARNDYRVLQPRLVIDANRNRSAAAFDALGLVVGTALMGKEGENVGDSLDGFEPDLDEATIIAHMADPLGEPHSILNSATTRLVHDLHQYERTNASASPQPSVVYTLARETHVSNLAPGELTKIRHGFSYSDGLGREIQQKIQAEPGRVTDGGPQVNPRWVGSGWTILNNKDKPVRKYEPFFSNTHEFEFARKAGVSPVLLYDPIDRLVATLYPNHTYEKTIFDPWRQETWDVNDTVLQDDPKNDPDVGGYFERLLDAEYLPGWHAQRATGAMGPDEESAAAKSAIHSATPALVYFDSLARIFLAVSHNRFERSGSMIDERYTTRFELDVEGNQRSVMDALGRNVFSHDYGLLHAHIHQNSADAGERWMLNDVTGKPLRMWDSRGHRIRHEYDGLRRPSSLFVQTEGEAERLVQRLVYGEGQQNDQALNLRGRAFQQFDGAGVITSSEYDFTGNLRSYTQQLLQEYRDEADWSMSPLTESETFTSQTLYDALNRPVSSSTPDASVIRPTYNEANLLESLSVNLRGAPTADTFVTNIDYNARGQRELIEYGNGTRTEYVHNPTTFRLTRLKTIRTPDGAVLQDLTFVYDPAGNVVSIRDAAQQTIYFNNQVVTADNEYVYDAVYRLIGASGREHIGQVSQPQPTWKDEFRINLPHPNDGQAMRNYNESYEYDPVGNIFKIAHTAANGSWTRSYNYDEPNPNPTNNRLTSTMVAAVLEQNAYDANGNIIQMPHLSAIEWDFRDRLRATQHQVVNNGSAEKTYYLYNAAGQRIRKITERQNGAKKQERIYLGGFELYREYDAGGSTTLERETLNVMDNKRRIALVDTKTFDATMPSNALPVTTIHYQFENQLGSVTLELDELGAVISYEEYYPYGGTSYQAGRSLAEVSLKRYRYTRKERDEESGLYYHGARYYAPWLGRWISCDPAGAVDGINLYAYVDCRPTSFVDPDGRQKKPPAAAEKPIWSDYFAEAVPAIVQVAKDKKIPLKNAMYLVIQAYTEQSPGVVGVPSKRENGYRLFNAQPEAKEIIKNAEGKIIKMTLKGGQESEGVEIKSRGQKEYIDGEVHVGAGPIFEYDSALRSATHATDLFKTRYGGQIDKKLREEKSSLKDFTGTLKPWATEPNYGEKVASMENQVVSQVKAWLPYRIATLESQIKELDVKIADIKQHLETLHEEKKAHDALKLEGIGEGASLDMYNSVENRIKYAESALKRNESRRAVRNTELTNLRDFQKEVK